MNTHIVQIEDDPRIIDNKQPLLKALESGRVLFLPEQSLTLDQDEQQLLTEELLDGSRKNISFNVKNNKLSAFKPLEGLNNTEDCLRHFMHRFAHYAKDLVDILLPQYKNQFLWGRTSYRPAEVEHRQLSKRKDDSRLHVDAFPGSPVYGYRIMRVFCNINPYGTKRVWNLGEPFPKVLSHFASRLKAYNPLFARILHLIKATKQTRSAYDHYMIHLHDHMKLDDHYQENVKKETFAFPTNSTWIVFTDQVSHAALSGQYLLEQTFYLPVSAMANPDESPLHKLEQVRSFRLKNSSIPTT